MYFAASREELLKAGESPENGAKLPGGGYLAMIGVYHELHCLVSIQIRIILRVLTLCRKRFVCTSIATGITTILRKHKKRTFKTILVSLN